MVRTGLVALLAAALAACSSAAATPSPSENSPTSSLVASTEPSVEPTEVPTEAATPVPADPSDFILIPEDVPGAFGGFTGLALGEPTVEREITLDNLADFEGADYAAQLEQDGFVSGHIASFGLADLSSTAYGFDNSAGAAAYQAQLVEDLIAAGCTDAGDSGTGIGDVSTALLCPAIGPVAPTAWIIFALDTTAASIRLKSLDGTSGPSLELLAEIVRNLEARVSG